MFNRKLNFGLSKQDVCNLSDSNHIAKTIGLPLNTFVTVRTCRQRDMSVSMLSKEHIRIRANYDSFARRHKFTPAYAYTRETNPDGTGEHLHMLCYVPAKLFLDFRCRAFTWMPCPIEIRIKKAALGESTARDGKRHSILLYIAKQMTPQAVYKTNLRRVKGGAILGKRWNASRNILRSKQKGRPNVESNH